MDVVTYTSIDQVDAGRWDALVGKNRIICTHKYIKAVEASGINDCRYFYPVVYEGGDMLAHATVYYISTELDTFVQGAAKKVISAVRRVWKQFLIMRTLECGTPVALGNTICFKDGVDRVQALGLLRDAVERRAKEMGVRVVLFRDFYEDEADPFDHLKARGYVRINNMPNARIPVAWGSFEEYLDSLRSHYKWKIIKRMKKFYREDLSMEVVDNFSEHADTLERLWTNVYDNAKEYKRERLSADFFRNIDTYLGGRSALIMAKKKGVPVGFTLLLIDDEKLIPMYSGIDYAYNEQYCTYFNLLYKIVQVAIERKMEEIDMGATTLVPKKDLGSSISSLKMYMKHLNPLLNMVVPRLFDSLAPADTTGPRRAFKEDV